MGGSYEIDRVIANTSAKQLDEVQYQSEKKVEEWQSNIALLTINAHINPLKQKYKKNKQIVSYIDNVKKDILFSIFNKLNFSYMGILMIR